MSEYARQNRYGVVLNGISLADLDAAIIITDVQYEEPQYEYENTSITGRQGARITGKRKEKAGVSVTFMIRAYPVVERQDICQKVISWAMDGGDLMINDRPWQKLVCVCEQLPAVTSVRNWTDELTVSFAAYEIPYWQDVEPTTLELSTEDPDDPGTATDAVWGAMFVPGNAPEAVAEITVEIGENYTKQFYFQTLDHMYDPDEDDDIHGGLKILYGPGFNAGDVVRITYDQHMIQSVTREYDTTVFGETVRETMALDGWRTGADDIVLNCGKTNYLYCSAYKWTSDVHLATLCTITFSVRGLWE